MATLNRRPVRKSLPLSPRDLRDIEMLRGSYAHRSALSDLSTESVDESSSEAVVLHAIWEAGMNAVREAVEEGEYARMAEDYDMSARKAVARRRRPAWADE